MFNKADFIDITDIKIETNSPGSCADETTPAIRLSNPCANTVIDPSAVFAPIEIYLDDPDPASGQYNFAHIADSVSNAQGDNLFCGTREFAFDVANLITVSGPGAW